MCPEMEVVAITLFCFGSTEDAVHTLIDAVCESDYPDKRLLVRFFEDDWGLCDLDAMPPWDEISMHVRFGALTACIMTTASTRGLRVCWDIDNIGGSILRWESDPPSCAAEEDIWERLCLAAVMTAAEAKH